MCANLITIEFKDTKLVTKFTYCTAVSKRGDVAICLSTGEPGPILRWALALLERKYAWAKNRAQPYSNFDTFKGIS